MFPLISTYRGFNILFQRFLGMSILLLSLLLTISIVPVKSKENPSYWISMSCGSDLNPGTSPQSAWQSLDPLTTALSTSGLKSVTVSISPGDYLLKKLVWAGEVSLSLSHCVKDCPQCSSPFASSSADVLFHIAHRKDDTYSPLHQTLPNLLEIAPENPTKLSIEGIKFLPSTAALDSLFKTPLIKSRSILTNLIQVSISNFTTERSLVEYSSQLSLTATSIRDNLLTIDPPNAGNVALIATFTDAKFEQESSIFLTHCDVRDNHIHGAFTGGFFKTTGVNSVSLFNSSFLENTAVVSDGQTAAGMVIGSATPLTISIHNCTFIGQRLFRAIDTEDRVTPETRPPSTVEARHCHAFFRSIALRHSRFDPLHVLPQWEDDLSRPIKNPTQGSIVAVSLIERVSTIESSIFEDNFCDQGTISQSIGPLSNIYVQNCKFSRNFASVGGSVFQASGLGMITLSNLTITDSTFQEPSSASAIIVTSSAMITVQDIQLHASKSDNNASSSTTANSVHDLNLLPTTSRIALTGDMLLISGVVFDDGLSYWPQDGSLLQLTSTRSTFYSSAFSDFDQASETICNVSNSARVDKKISAIASSISNVRIQGSLTLSGKVPPVGGAPIDALVSVTSAVGDRALVKMSNVTFEDIQTQSALALRATHCNLTIEHLSILNYRTSAPFPRIISFRDLSSLSVADMEVQNSIGGLEISRVTVIFMTRVGLHHSLSPSQVLMSISSFTSAHLVYFNTSHIQDLVPLLVTTGQSLLLAHADFSSNSNELDMCSGIQMVDLQHVYISHSNWNNLSAQSAPAILGWRIGNTRLYRSSFANNEATGSQSGAVLLNAQFVVLEEVVMNVNTAPVAGCLQVEAFRLFVSSSSFTACLATASPGGAIFYATPNVNQLEGPSFTAVVIQNTSFVGNSALMGAALHIVSDNSLRPLNLTIDNITASDNCAISIYGCHAELRRNFDSAFKAELSTTRGTGGALSIGTSSATVSITNSRFYRNTALYGAAIFISTPSSNGHSCAFHNNEFDNNLAFASGGAIYTDTGEYPLLPISYNLTHNLFANNSANWGGSIAIVGQSFPHISATNSVWSGNRAVIGGGALFVAGTWTYSRIVADGLIFNDNSAEKGGVIFYNFLHSMWIPDSEPVHSPCETSKCSGNFATGFGPEQASDNSFFVPLDFSLPSTSASYSISRLEDYHRSERDSISSEGAESEIIYEIAIDRSSQDKPLLKRVDAFGQLYNDSVVVHVEVSIVAISFGSPFETLDVVSSEPIPAPPNVSLSRFSGSSFLQHGTLIARFGVLFDFPEYPLLQVNVTLQFFSTAASQLVRAQVSGCRIGTHFDPELGCIHCDEGQMSLDRRGQCTNCRIKQGFCRDGLPWSFPGYYITSATATLSDQSRSPNDQIMTIKCQGNSCMGKNICSKFRTGFACASCIEGRSESWTSYCSKCDGVNRPLVVLVLLVLWIGVLLLHILIARSSGKATILLAFIQIGWFVAQNISFAPLLSWLSSHTGGQGGTDSDPLDKFTFFLCLFPMDIIARKFWFAMVPFIMAAQLTLVFLVQRLASFVLKIPISSTPSCASESNKSSELFDESSTAINNMEPLESSEKLLLRKWEISSSEDCELVGESTDESDANSISNDLISDLDTTPLLQASDKWTLTENDEVDPGGPHQFLKMSRKPSQNVEQQQLELDLAYSEDQWREQARFFHTARFVRSILALVSQSYASVSGFVLLFVDCNYMNGALKDGFLNISPSTSCGTQRFYYWSITLLIFVPWLLFCLCFILTKLIQLKFTGRLSKLDVKFGVWYEMFKPQFFWYKILELIRRNLIGMPAFYGTNSISTGNTQAFILIVSFGIQLLLQPYLGRLENVLATVSIAGLILLALLPTWNPMGDPRLAIIIPLVALIVLASITIVICLAFGAQALQSRILPKLKSWRKKEKR